jgi:3-isopropylmalate/(R)-2-methylmalate dehydratase small subunit
MPGLTELTAVGAVLLRDHIDTDAIIPSREIRAVSKSGLAQGLFAGWRYLPGSDRIPDPTFVLNDPHYRGARILLTGANFGCGSSREHAVWALAEYGFSALIASSFNSIFYRNCLRNGVLPVTLALPEIRLLAAWVAEDPQQHRLTVNLQTRQITGADRSWTFDIGDDAREQLLEGLSEIDRTLKLRDAIEAFRAADRTLRPWVYDMPSSPDLSTGSD